MSQKLVTTAVIVAFILLLIAGLWMMTVFNAELPNRLSQHETIVLGQNRLVPGSQAALRVVVRDSRNASPLPGAEIKISLKSTKSGKSNQVYRGTTDNEGTANVSFKVPEDGEPDQTLLIETRSRLGSDTLERPVTLERDYRILLSTDKPIYQPGQVIHVRALSLSTFDRTPAKSQGLEVVIADGKGNKVYKTKLTTSLFGVASTDFQLANEVNTGAYKISAVLGNTTSEKTVTVEHYVLPKFNIDLTTEKPYYLPGQHIKGSLNAQYFFGKPVGGAQVSLEGYTFDVERSVIITLQGNTDETGNFDFEFDLPSYFAGSDLESGRGRFYLQASVTDLAQHRETSNLSLPIAQNSLIIDAIPEGGQFRPGVDNILYVLTSYPDGTPAETSLKLSFIDGQQPLDAQTGSYGLAAIHLTPQSPYQQFSIQGRDVHGNTAARDFSFEGTWAPETVLLRPDKPVYKVGDTMKLTFLTSQAMGTVYLDIIREGQTVSTRSVEVSSGRAETAVNLTPDLFGTLELHGYKILGDGNIARDTRLVVVDQAADLNVTLTPGQGTYRPGDQAGLDIQVNGKDGIGIPSAIGLAIVDESVFALAEQDPGFAKLYFLLEQELLQPKYELHGFSIIDLVSPLPPGDSNPSLRGAVEEAAQASLAAAVPQSVKFSLSANSHTDAMQRANNQRQIYFVNLSKGLYGLTLAIPLVVLGSSTFAVWRQKRLSYSLALTLGLVLIVVLAFLLWPLAEAYQWAHTPLERLSVMVVQLSQGWILLLTFIGFVGYLALVVIAWLHKDPLLGFGLGLILFFVISLGFILYAISQAGIYPSQKVVSWGVVAFSLIPISFLLWFGSYSSARQPVAAMASLAFSIFLLVGMLPLLMIGSQDRRFEGEVMDQFGGRGMIMEKVMGMPATLAPMPTQAPAPGMGGLQLAQAAGQSAATPIEPPRLRQYFPETMLWLPEAATDNRGSLHLDFPVADSITTWRMTALASSQDGQLGSATAGLRVFQDFFIDLDLPLALTVGDEVSIPVGIYSYLPDAQTVRLELDKPNGFDLLDDPVKEITIEANDISVVYFRVKAVGFGRQSLKVTAFGSRMSDAIQKDVRVYPNGKQITFTQSDRLNPGTPVHQMINIPVDAIPGAQSLVVKVYPGILSQVVEGLDSILRMPNGCFEQTSSTTYPNVLVLDYLKTMNQASPEVQMKAEEYINLGYQRLTTFEVGGSGGFSLFGEPPADPMLTAYGIQEFSDMSRVYEVDPALIQRAANWLLSQQEGDGSWKGLQGFHESTLTNQTVRLPVAAYIAWSLVEAGFGGDARTQKGLGYLRENQSQANDPYGLALIANALVAADIKAGGSSHKITPATQAVLDRLAGMAIQSENSVHWQNDGATFMGSQGETSNLETTALATLALLRADSHTELTNAALTYLIKNKDSFGTWETTQATVMTLKALLQSVRGGAEKVDASITVSLNGGQTQTIKVTPDQYDVVQLLSFDDLNPGQDNRVDIQVDGSGNLMYQIAGSYYIPWGKLSQYPELSVNELLVDIKVSYDRTSLSVNDTVNVSVTVSMIQEGGVAKSALIDLGMPPGFTIQAEDLDALVARFNDLPGDYAFPKIERYELTGRQILVYVSNLSYGKPLQFNYRLRARYPLMAQTPSSNAYDYYNPGISGEVEPELLVVNP